MQEKLVTCTCLLLSGLIRVHPPLDFARGRLSAAKKF